MRVPHLFFSTDPEQQTLHRRITPTAEQRAQQQDRWTDLRDYLIGDLAERSELPMSSWLQGSYKLGTQVRPVKDCEFDIDLGIYFEWRGGAHNGRYAPYQLKEIVQQSLLAYAAEAEDDVLGVIAPPKERCSRIRFSGQFHIDVPSYHLDREDDRRELATQTHGWEVSDPKAFVVWFRGMFGDDDSVQARRLIRYLKIWAALNLENPPSSILLTVLVAEAYGGLTAAQKEGDDVALQHIVGALRERLNRNVTVPNPVRRAENLNRLSADDLRLFIGMLHVLANIVDAALNSATESASSYHWSEAFQHFFPAPREAARPDAGRAIVPVAFDPQVAVEARPNKNDGRAFHGTNEIGPIPKECSIVFTLQNAGDLPPGAQVRWMVRNEGAEAEQVNDLGHVSGRGNQVTDRSAYRGTHYMDVVVTSAAGGVLGYRRVPVQISGIVMPPRNPKRPGWTRFRRR